MSLIVAATVTIALTITASSAQVAQAGQSSAGPRLSMVPETPKLGDGSTVVGRSLMLQRTMTSSNPRG